MRRDERLIDLFLRGYRDRAGNSYRLVERPDRAERGRPAIDCIAENGRRDRLAIEHTLVEPFEGQKADDQPFLAVFESLHHSPELTVPKCSDRHSRSCWCHPERRGLEASRARCL